jgi:hypothetical protein
MAFFYRSDFGKKVSDDQRDAFMRLKKVCGIWW